MTRFLGVFGKISAAGWLGRLDRRQPLLRKQANRTPLSRDGSTINSEFRDTPKAFHNKAQGRRAAAHPGYRTPIMTLSRRDYTGRYRLSRIFNPFGIKRWMVRKPRVRYATLGYGVERLRRKYRTTAIRLKNLSSCDRYLINSISWYVGSGHRSSATQPSSSSAYLRTIAIDGSRSEEQ